MQEQVRVDVRPQIGHDLVGGRPPVRVRGGAAVVPRMFRWRHLIVAVGLVPALIIYIGLVMQIADMLTSIHMLLDLLFYVVAGLAWIPAASKVVGWLATHESH